MKHFETNKVKENPDKLAQQFVYTKETNAKTMEELKDAMTHCQWAE